ncbi:MAG: DNA polymerase III subunit alpha, partial [Gallionella sp.]|nr:DNA polymerase III subunit alpha [Gallionella sp.]
FDKDDVEAIGLVKFDFLGLRTLTILDWAMKHVARLSGGTAPFTLETMPLDDRPTYDLLKACNTTAVFQLESRGMKDLIKRLQPDTFEDIVALVALFRPGPLESGMVEDFINRKHGRAKADYFHPELEVSLKPTYGVIVYQEQVMTISQIIGGYTLGGADMLRRAMGKKNPEEMAKHRDIFVGGAIKRGIDDKLATLLFDLMEKFAGYGFNKSHSAAYALIAYQTAYLKAHHPAAFMAATLSGDLDNTEKVHTFYADTLQQGIRVLLPDVNSSGYAFSPVDEKTIAYGLGAIKGTGEAAIGNIAKAREQGPFKDLFDFCRRVDKRIVNRRTVEALIRAGAFDCINDHRASLMASVDAALASADQHARAANQNSLFGDDEADVALIEKHADVPRWRLREQLAHEKASLGIYLGGHPFQEFAGELANFVKVKLADLTPQFVGQGNGSSQPSRRGVPVLLAGIVSGVRIQQTRRGRMAIISLDDGGAQIEATVFNEEYERSRPWLRDDELLVVRGKASLDEYSGNVRVSADELFDFASARSHYVKQLELCCDSKIGIAQLKKIFSPWRDGKCPVLIHYANGEASCLLRLGEAWQVTLHDDMLRDLRDLLGQENVKLVYP